MEHPIIAIAAPLVELNPIKYAMSTRYREKALAKMGKRARRIFYYQIFMGLVAITIIFVVVSQVRT